MTRPAPFIPAVPGAPALTGVNLATASSDSSEAVETYGAIGDSQAARGLPGRFSPDSTLVFEFELVEIKK